MTAPVEYANVRIYPTAEDLAGWTLTWDDRRAVGACPRCTHQTVFTWEAVVVEMARRATARTEVVSGRVDCACGHDHSDSTGTKSSCGAFWYATFSNSSTGPAVTPLDDHRLIAATEAFQAAAQDQDTRLRGAAEKWLGGVAAILGLFSLATTVTGSSFRQNLGDTSRAIVVGMALAAVLAAIIAIVSSYLAAYGWPRTVVGETNAQRLDWYDGRQNRTLTTARRLRRAVVAAAVSICLITAGTGIVWLTPTPAVEPNTKVTLTDESTVCGLLLNSDHNGEIRLRTTDGTVRTVDVTTLVKIAGVATC